MSHWTTVSCLKIKRLLTLRRLLADSANQNRLKLRNVQFADDGIELPVVGWKGEETAQIVAVPMLTHGFNMEIGWRSSHEGGVQMIADSMLISSFCTEEWQNKLLQLYNLQVVKENNVGKKIKVIEKEGTFYAFVKT